MGCGCGKSREQRLAERLERKERFLAQRQAAAERRADRIAAQQRQPVPENTTKAA